MRRRRRRTWTVMTGDTDEGPGVFVMLLRRFKTAENKQAMTTTSREREKIVG
jgi:hypothetical protein